MCPVKGWLQPIAKDALCHSRYIQLKPTSITPINSTFKIHQGAAVTKFDCGRYNVVGEIMLAGKCLTITRNC